MAAKSHSYSLRVRQAPPAGNGAKAREVKRPSRPLALPSPSPPSTLVGTPVEKSGIRITNEEESVAKYRTYGRRIRAHLLSKQLTSSRSSSSKKPKIAPCRSASGTNRSVKRQSSQLSDIEDLQTGGRQDGEAPQGDRFGEGEAASIRSCLLNWYDENQRILPWRRNADNSLSPGSFASTGLDQREQEEDEQQQQRAYEVWISEVMLQQTRVATVIAYYNRWMEKWPAIGDLARASLEDVYSVWAGLGYYRRARFLLEGAKQIVEKHSGIFPACLTDLRKVPGIGNYTAGAIASIAFGKPVPVVDGNVVRVLCRLRAISDSPKASTTIKLLWALAEELVEEKRPGDHNQAVMELGATLCTPKSPSCSSCPVASHCKALTLNSVLDYPSKVAKVPPRAEYVSVCILEASDAKQQLPHTNNGCSSAILLMRRPNKGLLAGLWEFPSVLLGDTPVSAKEQQTAMDAYLKTSLGLDLGSRGLLKRREPLGTHLHIFSHIRWHMSIERLVVSSPSGKLQKKIQEFRAENLTPIKWIARDCVLELGLTSSVKKIYEMYLDRLAKEQEV